MKSIRVYWDDALGWTIEVPFALSRPQAEAAVAWVKKIQSERIRSMPYGDRKEQAAKALASLTATSLHQRVLAKPQTEFSLVTPGK